MLSVVKIEASKKTDLKEIGPKLAMHVAASAPMAIDKNGIKQTVIDKELEIIKEELKNSGKEKNMIDKISKGKLNKFISCSTRLGGNSIVWDFSIFSKISFFVIVSKVFWYSNVICFLIKLFSDNTLLNQIWIMDTKKKVKDILKEEIKIVDFIRFKVGEGID